LAARHQLKTLAFPSISTGVYRYPLREASRIAVAALGAGIKNLPGFEKITLVLFSSQTFLAYRESLEEWRQKNGEASSSLDL